MDTRVHQVPDHPDMRSEEVIFHSDPEVDRCTTYDELDTLIDAVGDITEQRPNYESNTLEPKTYTVEEIKRNIREIRDGKRSIHDLPEKYTRKVLLLLPTDRENRTIKIDLTK